MITLGDAVEVFFEKYIKRSPTKEQKVVAPELYGTELTKDSDDPQLTPQLRASLAHQSPIFMKGVNKKTMDSIRAWFKLETLNGTKAIQYDLDAIDAFEKRSQYKKKFKLAVVDAHVYGDGFLLIQFDEKDKGVSIENPPPKGSEPRNVIVVSPERMKSVEYLSDKNRDMDLYHYVYEGSEGKQYIHPDRIQHVIIDEVSNSKLGLSKVDLLRNTIKSKKNVDIAVGRILSWFSHGILDIKAYDLTDAELKNVRKIAKTHPSVWLHDPEDFEIEVLQPEAIDPQPFMDFIVLNIASALIMPVHVLTGIQVGKVTGAEIGFADYYRDIKDIQELIYTPLIEDLYRKIIEARGREWKYNLIWNTVYVDELGEAIIMEKRAAFISQAVQAGILSVEEGRDMMNNGMVDIDPKKEPKPPQPKIPFNPPTRKNKDKEEKKPDE